MAGLKRAQTSVSDYIGTTPPEQPSTVKAVDVVEEAAAPPKIITKANTKTKMSTKKTLSDDPHAMKRIGFRVYHLAKGASKTYDKYAAVEDEKFAMKTFITDALNEWIDDVSNGAVIVKKPEYEKGITTYQSTRNIPQAVYDKACEVFDPFSKKADHSIATAIANAAIQNFITKGN